VLKNFKKALIIKLFWHQYFGQTQKNLIYVFSSSIISKLFGATTTLLLPNLLGPTNYGAWITLILISSYSPIFHLGVLEAMFKQVPYYIGRHEYERAKRLEGNVIGFVLIAALIFLFLGILAVNLIDNKIILAFRVEASLVVATATTGLISSFQYFRLSAHQKFKYCAVVDAGRSILSSIIVIVLTLTNGLYGTVLGYLIAELLILYMSFALAKKHCGNINLTLDIKIIKDAITIGLPITLTAYLASVASTVDRIISSIYLGKTMTGYYGLGFSAVNLLSQIPKTVNSVLYPKINEELGKNSNNQRMAYLAIFPTIIASIILPFVIGSSIQFVPIIYLLFFPEYICGLASAQILLIGFYFGSLSSGATSFLIAKVYNFKIMISTLISAGFGAVITILLLNQELGLIALALGHLISALLYSIIVWSLVLKDFKFNKSEKLHYFSVFYGPVIVMFCLYCIERAVIPLIITTKLYCAIASISLFVFIYLTIFTMIRPFKDWREMVFTEIRNSFMAREKK
jgi:O-antigen/teichoic acid export membrane protein